MMTPPTPRIAAIAASHAASACGNLLSNAVNVAAAQQNFACLNANEASARKKLLQLARDNFVGLCIEQRQHDD